MPDDLYLVLAPIYTAEGYPVPGYVRQRLTPARIKELITYVSDVADEHTRGFFDDPRIDTYPVEFAFYLDQQWPDDAKRILKLDDGTLLGSFTSDATPTTGRVYRGLDYRSIVWELRPKLSSSGEHVLYCSVPLDLAVLHAAWCLICPDHELLKALRRLVDWDPLRVARWIAEGQIAADDGSWSRSLPPFEIGDILPLLRSFDVEVRQQTIAGLARLSIDANTGLRLASR